MSERPLSPHLQIYKFFPTMAMSILHRISGVWLSLGLLVLVYWLGSAAGGEADYDQAIALFASWPLKVLLFAWLGAWCYHSVNGLRHLGWDAALGMEKAQVRRSRWMVVGVTALAWLLLAWLLFGARGVKP
jgi:succinate dehydrogenase / fumarate reductase cytochrome b subunit